jgi:hypothetical protein
MGLVGAWCPGADPPSGRAVYPRIALDLLNMLLDEYDEILATPNVFTEVSNLINTFTGRSSRRHGES